MATQGAMANANGKVFENMMIPMFEGSGFEVFKETQMNKMLEQNKFTCKKYVIANAKYKTIYGSEGRTEFVIVDNDRRIRVEAKYQASPGSVDEKYPYMLLNGIYQYPESEVIFVVDGGGYKAGALQWLKDKVDENWLEFKEKGKNIQVMNIAEFMNWFNHQFR